MVYINNIKRTFLCFFFATICPKKGSFDQKYLPNGAVTQSVDTVYAANTVAFGWVKFSGNAFKQQYIC